MKTFIFCHLFTDVIPVFAVQSADGSRDVVPSRTASWNGKESLTVDPCVIKKISLSYGCMYVVLNSFINKSKFFAFSVHVT